MSWIDAIQGALSAGAQGIQQKQRLDLERKQMMLQEWQQRREQERQDFSQLEAGIIPGAPVDPEVMARAVKTPLKSRIRVGHDGIPVWAESPQDTLTRIRISNEEMIGKEAAAKATIAQEQVGLRKQLMENPDILFGQPYEKQQLLWANAGLPGQAPQSIEEFTARQRAMDWGQVAAASTRAALAGQRAPREMTPAQQLDFENKLRIAAAQKLLMEKGPEAGVTVLNNQVLFAKDRPEARVALEQKMNEMRQQYGMGGAPAAPAAAATVPGGGRVRLLREIK